MDGETAMGLANCSFVCLVVFFVCSFSNVWSSLVYKWRHLKLTAVDVSMLLAQGSDCLL